MSTEEPPAEPTGPRAARVAGAVAYAAQGVCFASLVTRIPAIQDRFGLDPAGLALLLLLVPVVAGVGSVAAGQVAARTGVAPALRALGPVVPIALVAVGLSPTLPVLVCSLIVVGLALGSVDALMNEHGVAVEARYGRSIMASFYAVFSLAGIVGAGLAAAAASTALPLAGFFALVAVIVIPVQLVAGPRLLRGRRAADPAAAEPDEGEHARPQVPWRPLLLIGVGLMCVYVADSAASNWSAVYLTDGLGSSESVAALAYLAFALTTLLARLVADRGVTIAGPATLVRIGGLVGAGAIVLVALAPSAPVALLGFAVLGLGVAPVIPLAFSAAGSHDRGETGVAVARVNVFNYAGYVLGAPLVGLVAEVSSLRWGFAVVAPLLLVTALLAPRFVPRAAGTRSRG